ncbi:MAG TPA: glycosyltransferase [Solirubrobacteraceae bacterium]|nr:glycosyltransferase [Solirubrobacteraceae bacterium]
MTDADPASSRRPLRAAVLGVSERRTCGVRDHATLLAGALAAEGVGASMHWLTRSAHTLRGARSEFLGWTDGLAQELAGSGAEAIVLHYSVFSYSYRGLPLFVRPTRAAIRRSGLPLLALMHEFAYPWGLGGARGELWAATQRVALRGLVRDSAALVVTAPFRAEWLESRAWLPRRELAVAPVFSNLPAPSGARAGERSDRGSEGPLVGLFGYAYEGAARSLLLDGLRLLRDRGVSARLQLLGAPGPDAPAAEAWRAAARERGLDQALSFSGVLGAQELSDALASCDVLLHAEPTGPTSRKGTLAASLASGRPVVAIDGPLRWDELLAGGAALVVADDPSALADALADLLEHASTREALGQRGREFAERAMGVERSASVVRRLLDGIVR